MNDTIATPTPATPGRSFWIVAVLSLLWNAFGALDYTLTNLRYAAYLKNFPTEMVQVIDAMPVWTLAAWALGVWGALAGSILLLIRSRFAIHAFAVSLLGLAVSSSYQFTLDLPASLDTKGMNAMMLVIWIIAVGLLLYAIRMRRQGVLR